MLMFFLLCVVITIIIATTFGAELRFANIDRRWSVEKANEWLKSRAYQAGVNFVPSTAVNELEMFQKETYDPITIERELVMAQQTGFNTLRVFLHNLLWENDSNDLISRMNDFLGLTSKYGFTVTFVLLDSCWNPNPALGPQPDPIPGVHNSQWVQAPGYDIIHSDMTSFENKIKPYIQGVLKAFSNDKRILAWDLWNEPNNSGYADDLIAPLITNVFEWAREIDPAQPLTTPIWNHMDNIAKPGTFQNLQAELSDILSYHDYAKPLSHQQTIDVIRQYDNQRPIICTEYMARTAGSTFRPILAMLQDQGIYAYNWGLTSGKTQTIYPWSTTTEPATEEPTIWFHDVYRANGTAFHAPEVQYIQSILLPAMTKQYKAMAKERKQANAKV